MILIDFSQRITAIVAMNPQSSKAEIKHLVINNLRSISHKFKRTYGKMVICCDSKNYWRTSIFPYYKASRSESKKKSPIDWNMVYEASKELKLDIKQHFPYKLMEVDRCEADDIIGVLSPLLSRNEAVLIVSTDGDFKQLQRYDGVKQYNPILEILIISDNPTLSLKEKIITGDRGDGIPSILSKDSVFVEKIRQQPLRQNILATALQSDFDDPNTPHYINIQRNRNLIDFEYIPKEYRQNILTEYNNKQPGNKSLLMNYLIANDMILLIECLSDF